MTQYESKFRANPGKPAQIAKNRAFYYGDGLFETIRLQGKRLVFWEDHLARLKRGMKILGLNPGVNKISGNISPGTRAGENDPEEIETELSNWGKQIQEEIKRIIPPGAVSPDDVHRVRLSVWRAGGGKYTPETDGIDWLLEIEPVVKVKEEKEPTKSIRLIPFNHIKLGFGPLSSLKTLNTLPYVLAARFAKIQAYDDALLLGPEGIAETSRANLFAVIKGNLFTPPLTAGCVDGVLRKNVILWTENEGIPFTQAPISLKMISQATEVFTTNVIQGIVPVSEIKGTDILLKTSKLPVTRQLQNTFLQKVLN